MVADRNRGLLLSTLNHDIRTPMNGILRMASLLNDTGLNAAQQEYNSAIIHSGQALMKMINQVMMNDILECSRVDAGKELESKEIDLVNCIEDILDLFAVKAAGKNIDLLYNIDEAVPPQIIGDSGRIRQVLMNLLENAIQFTAAGEIIIAVKLLECKEDNRIKLEFEVKDSGTGISADKRAVLLKNISSQNAGDSVVNDSGLGLVICNKLVNLMGGKLNIESNMGNGTVVKFSMLTKAGMNTIQRYTQSVISDLENRRVLIIDSNIIAADLMKQQLEQSKIIASTVSCGDEALDLLTQVSFDLVITGLTLKDMNGIELANSIKKRHPDLPVILLNTVTNERFKQCPEIFGAVLNKPVKINLLLDAMITQWRIYDSGDIKKQRNRRKLSPEFSKQYPLKILVAEDNPVNQKWTSKTLAKLGYQADVVSNGREVLEVVSAKQYDLLLMDVQMPVMDGLEVTRMIRLCLEAQPVVIAMTGNVMQGDRQICMQSGMDDYISKPIELDALVAMLEKWALLVKGKKQLCQQAKLSKKNFSTTLSM